MAQDEQPAWDYKPSGSVASAPEPARVSAKGSSGSPPARSSMSWTASEFIDHERGAGWYLMLIVATAALAALAYLFTKDYFALGTIIILGVIVAIAARSKPREIKYELTDKGIQVGEKFYSYSDFRSFSIIREGALNSIEFMPMKKLMFPPSAYFGPGDEERIMDIIGQHLPYEDRKMDRIDRLSRRLRL